MITHNAVVAKCHNFKFFRSRPYITVGLFRVIKVWVLYMSCISVR